MLQKIKDLFKKSQPQETKNSMKSKTDIERFVEAQKETYYGGYKQAMYEIQTGGKRSHWIWYIFPQLRGLGHSAFADYYGITDLNEARTYLAHPILGIRLREITNAVLAYPEHAAPQDFMGSGIDALKLRSCMTLFDAIEPNNLFAEVLDKFYNGKRDELTLKLLQL